MAPPLSSPAASAAAHSSFASSLHPDLPLLLHGSGDVEPSNVDPDTVSILADLTATYVGRLVDAAVDAHDVLTDGAGGIRPPPPFPEPNRDPSDAAAFSRAGGSTARKRPRAAAASATAAAGGGGVAGQKKDTLPTPGGPDDCWDVVPVPEPKVKQRKAESDISSDGSAGGGAGSITPQVGPDEWIGLAGVDLFQSRRRVPYASPPTTIDTKCFIFPICHDAALYGRVMEVQAARRTVAPVLTDPIWMDVVETEGREAIRAVEAGRGVGEALGEGDADADTDRTAGLRRGAGDGAVWPGLEMLLPTHRGDDC